MTTFIRKTPQHPVAPVRYRLVDLDRPGTLAEAPHLDVRGWVELTTPYGLPSRWNDFPPIERTFELDRFAHRRLTV